MEPSIQPVLGNPVILYDGSCGFCSSVVVFVAERDKQSLFRYSPLQSALGQRVLQAAALSTNRFDTFVLLESGSVYTKSSAALRIALHLGRPWSFARPLGAIPAPVRDFVYDLVARNRHRLFPSNDRCLTPAALQGKILEGNEPLPLRVG